MTEKSLGIVDVLSVLGFDPGMKTKLIRHQDKRYDVGLILRQGWFELYQRLNSRPVFRDCEQVVSFVGDGSGRARFVGVFDVRDEKPASKGLVPENCPYKDWDTGEGYVYEMHRREEFKDLEGRIVIDWGLGALAYHQHLKNKPIIEIFPKGRSLAPFADYLGFTLTFQELADLYQQEFAHRDWKASLSAVSGVYMILAETTGEQYVGSAYGLDGFWGRWAQYATSYHGGNVRLKELLKNDSSYPSAFRYSILQVLPKSTTALEVIRWECQYKEKLGSRAKGLNSN